MARITWRVHCVQLGRGGHLILLVVELLDLFLQHVNHGVHVREFVLGFPLAHHALALIRLRAQFVVGFQLGALNFSQLH